MPSSRVATVAPPTVIRLIEVPAKLGALVPAAIVAVDPSVPAKATEPVAPSTATEEPAAPLTVREPLSLPDSPRATVFFKPTVIFLPSASAVVVMLPSPAIWIVLPRSCLTAVLLSSVKPKPPVAFSLVPSIIASLTVFS